MWGNANYFAFKSSYSNANYAYTAENGLKQMFMALVNVGKTIEL